MRITDIESRHEDGAGVLEATVEPRSGGSMRLFYRVRGVEGVPEPLGDALVVGLLVACMHEPEDLELDVPVSRTLLNNLVQAQDIFTSWFDNLHRIEVQAPVYDGPRHTDRERGVACCFTSGVDSLYTLRKHLDEVTHLFLVRGMDVSIDPSRDGLWELIRGRLSTAAAELDRPLITVETNLREIADKRRAAWGRPHPTDFWGSRSLRARRSPRPRWCCKARSTSSYVPGYLHVQGAVPLGQPSVVRPAMVDRRPEVRSRRVRGGTPREGRGHQ